MKAFNVCCAPKIRIIIYILNQSQISIHSFIIGYKKKGLKPAISAASLKTMKPATPSSQVLMMLRKHPFENIVGKGENAFNQHFLFFPQCFLTSQSKLYFL